MELNLTPTRQTTKKRRRKKTARHSSRRQVELAQNENKATLETTHSDDVSEAIGKVLQSKTDARRKRKIEGLQAKSYQEDSKRPITCLFFVLPILIFYEVGSILLGAQSFRSGVDQWTHQLLYQIGFGQLVILPLVTVGIMLAWHHRIHDHWRVSLTTLFGMAIEAAGLGLILFCAANSLNLLSGGFAQSQSALDLSSAWWANVVSFVGSGLYEELIFRIMFLVGAIHVASRYLKNEMASKVLGVVVVSLMFAALHYSFFNPAGTEFELSSFVFRFIASIAFCVLFLFRGFGIAVGAHVAYDVLTQI